MIESLPLPEAGQLYTFQYETETIELRVLAVDEEWVYYKYPQLSNRQYFITLELWKKNTDGIKLSEL